MKAWESGHEQECKELQARGAGAGLRDAQETVRAALTGKTDRRAVAACVLPAAACVLPNGQSV